MRETSKIPQMQTLVAHLQLVLTGTRLKWRKMRRRRVKNLNRSDLRPKSAPSR